MSNVLPGRFTAKTDDPFVVFMIGMRINNPLALNQWLPTFRAMPPMLRELYKNPYKGFLGGEYFLYWPGFALVQYWRSFDDLERFARDRDDPHLPAWKRFNKQIGSDGTVGIWHETYVIEPGNHESIYANMPRFGLAKATEHVPATGGRETARSRISRRNKNRANSA